MNKKEIGELRRRLRADKNNINRIYGCYVNGTGEIISRLEASLGMMPEEEIEMYLARLKKSLSGTLGKNLIDLVFSTRQAADSEEHRLLMALCQSHLEDAEIREKFYQTVISSLDMGDSNYLILLACDQYDVPPRGRKWGRHAKHEEIDEDDDRVFTYIICSICPVKQANLELRYFHDVNMFHSSSMGQTAALTEIGFLFPAFDNRAANIYNVLYYARKPDEIHREVIDAVFHIAPPMSALEQREAFSIALSQALEEECNYEVIQSVHEQLRERIEQHKLEKNPEQLDLTAEEIGDILQNCGVSQAHIDAFCRACGEQFGENAVMNADNLIDSKKFEISTPDVKISVNPDAAALIETNVINGKPYLLIPLEQEIEINGIPVET